MGAINLEWIKQRRKVMKVSQDALASVLGMNSAAAYGHYESGRSDFKADHLPIICAALDCGLHDLFIPERTNGLTLDEMVEVVKELSAVMQNMKKETEHES